MILIGQFSVHVTDLPIDQKARDQGATRAQADEQDTRKTQSQVVTGSCFNYPTEGL